MAGVWVSTAAASPLQQPPCSSQSSGPQSIIAAAGVSRPVAAGFLDSQASFLDSQASFGVTGDIGIVASLGAGVTVPSAAIGAPPQHEFGREAAAFGAIAPGDTAPSVADEPGVVARAVSAGSVGAQQASPPEVG